MMTSLLFSNRRPLRLKRWPSRSPRMSIQPTEPIGALEQDEPIMTAPSAESEECASSREAHVSRCRRLRVPRMKCLRLPWTPLLFGMQLLRTSFLKNFLCKAHYVTTSAVPDEGEDEEATEAPLHIAAAGFSASGSSSATSGRRRACAHCGTQHLVGRMVCLQCGSSIIKAACQNQRKKLKTMRWFAEEAASIALGKPCSQITAEDVVGALLRQWTSRRSVAGLGGLRKGEATERLQHHRGAL